MNVQSLDDDKLGKPRQLELVIGGSLTVVYGNRQSTEPFANHIPFLPS